MKKYILILILLFSVAISAIEIASRLEAPDSLFVGTPFHLLVDFAGAKTDSIYIPPVDTLDIFILANTPKVTEKSINDSLFTNINFLFQPFDVGEYTLPAIEFMVKSDEGLKSYKSKEFILKINSTVPDSTQIISDIAKPVSIYLGFWDYLLIALIIAIPILLILYIRKFLKNRTLKDIKEIIVDSRPAYEICLEYINKIKEENYLKRGDFLIYYFRLSYVLRLFIELNYKINAVEMTTSEIRTNLVLKDHDEKSEILKFLSNCDMIKFAKHIPKLSSADEALNWLEKYLKSFENREVTNA